MASNRITANEKTLRILIQIFFIISILAYEIHIYQYYTIIQIVLSALNITILSIIRRDASISKKAKHHIRQNIFPIFLSIAMVMSTLTATLIHPASSILSPAIVLLFGINTILDFYYLPVYLQEHKETKKRILNTIKVMLTIISMAGVIIYILGGVGPYVLESGRARSIYFDPNFFAVTSVIPFLLSIKNYKKQKTKTVLLGLLSFISVIVSGSRGTMLSIAAFVVYLILFKVPNTKIIKKIMAISITVIASIFLLNYLENINFLRLYQGTSGRAEMIQYSINELRKSPFVGYGYASISKKLKEGGYKNASTHNSLADYAFSYGVPIFILFISLLIYVVIISLQKQQETYLCALLIFLLANMNTILFNFGGVGIPSVLLTIIMGMIVYSKRGHKNEKN